MQQIFSYLISLLLLLKTQPAPLPKTTIYLTGDVMLARSVMAQAIAKNNYTYPFIYVSDKLKSADIVFSNLETPIKEKCPPQSENHFIFCADAKMLEGLKFAGINIVNLANNHTLNMGREGLTETEKILNDKGIKWVGDGNFETIEKNKIKFGFLGFDYVDNKLTDADLKLITESKKKVDILIVATHWGVEYQSTPTESQKHIANSIVEAGANVIAGTHPHWVQKEESIQGKPVFYSLGNFVFDQMWSEETRRGEVGQLNYEGKNLESLQEIPIYMMEFATPEWVQNNPITQYPISQ